VILRDATKRGWLPGIRARGLLGRKRRGRLPVVWLHSPGRTAWAVLHTIRSHGGRIVDVVVIELNVPRAWLPSNRRQYWYSIHDISPASPA